MVRGLLIAAVALIGTTGLTGCIPAMPAKESYPILNDQTNAILQGQGWSQITGCVDRLNRTRMEALGQRNVGAAFAYAGGALGVSSGVVSGVLDKEEASTKTALAFIAAGGALVALAAPLIGNPESSLEVHQRRGMHWDVTKGALFELQSQLASKPPDPGPAPDALVDEPLPPPALPEGSTDDAIKEWNKKFAEWKGTHAQWQQAKDKWQQLKAQWQAKKDAMAAWEGDTKALAKKVVSAAGECNATALPPAPKALPAAPTPNGG